ncbi:hypothetical protein ACIQWA_22885 [Kitasatospora sp. NPDC098652]|uniref:LppU/SCO3897 family protein n=1 Tax=Kitasatospora sp. NPDC098652 TaxID=3364095 RepID=UPI00380F7221
MSAPPPPQLPYGPPPGDGNPYAGGPYGAPPPPPPPGYGYPSAPPPPEQPYGAQPPGYGYGYPPPAPTDGEHCRFCGGFPAVRATVRGHQGLLIAFRMLRMHGPFCRTCGTATVRDMSARTLVQGWWSWVSPILTVITLLMNLGAHNRIKRLPPPMPGTHGPQLDPGTPLGSRPHVAMLLVPVSLLVTGVLLATGVIGPKQDSGPVAGPKPTDTVTFSPSPRPSPTFSYTPPPIPMPTFSLPSITLPPPATKDDVDSAGIGDCLRNENSNSATADDHPNITVLPCTDPKAQYKVVYKYFATSDEKVCEKQPKSDSSYTRTYTKLPSLNYVLCLKHVNG